MKSAREIIEILAHYRARVIDVFGLDVTTVITVASAYGFIIVDFNGIHLQFDIAPAGAKLNHFHPPDESIKRRIESTSWPGLDSSWKEEFPAHIIKQLTTADSVASLATNCTVGDSYRPGNFSKIIYADSHIELQQVNYMNAKSLDHKDNYSLRSLVFRISLKSTGKMITEFNDRSSENNRHCGERIQAALDWLPD